MSREIQESIIAEHEAFVAAGYKGSEPTIVLLARLNLACRDEGRLILSRFTGRLQRLLK